MRTIIVSAGVALILTLLGTRLAAQMFNKRRLAPLVRQAASGPYPTGHGRLTMGGAVIVIASLVGYLAGHLLTGDPAGVSGIEVLALMTGLGLVGLAADVLTSRHQANSGQRGGARPPWLDRFLVGAAVLALAAYVLIVTWQLRTSCSARLTTSCYIVRNPLDLAVAAASVLGGCIGFLFWNTRRRDIYLGATGTLALGGALAGLAAVAQSQVLVATGGLVVIIAVAVVRWSGYRSLR